MEDDIAFLLNRGNLLNPTKMNKLRWKYFLCFPEIKQNSYCISANIKIFFLVQYSNDIWKNHILTVLTLLKNKYLLLYNKRVIAWLLVNIVPRSISYYARTLTQNDIMIGTIFTINYAITLYNYYYYYYYKHYWIIVIGQIHTSSHTKVTEKDDYQIVKYDTLLY